MLMHLDMKVEWAILWYSSEIQLSVLADVISKMTAITIYWSRSPKY